MSTRTAPEGTGGKRRKAPTIFDVAERAGVSHQTVSRVINGDPTVREQYRTQVTDAVTALGYRPRAAARALAGGRSKALGIITAGDALYGPSSTSIGFERAARSAGYHVLLSTLPEEPTPSDLSGALTTLLAQDVAAIVLVAADNRVLDALASLTVPVTVPVVVSNAVQRDAVRNPVAPSVAAVAIDQAAGTSLVMQHLFDRGHRRIVHIAGPHVSQESEVRRATYVRIMQDAGLGTRRARGRLDPGERLRSCPAHRRWDGRRGVRGQRPDGARGAARLRRRGAAGARRHRGRGLRRRPRGRALHAAVDHRAAGLPGDGERVLDTVRALVEGEPRDETLLAPELVVRRSTWRPLAPCGGVRVVRGSSVRRPAAHGAALCGRCEVDRSVRRYSPAPSDQPRTG
ncbi:LacI family DNA-binding transcriptional regulator [Curtobacterium flaccumfaciens]|nr:LacI family DNA-binding transcriptional regulator [Curtobacterium flaccumfaciens]